MRLAQADPSIGVGLIVFSDSKDPTQGKGPYPTNVDIPIRLVDNTQMAALQERVQGVPAAATPTLPALQGAYPLLESFNPAAAALPPNGKKIVVLMTDGLPTEPPGPTQDQCIALANSAFTKAAPQGPIQLFVVGVGAFPGSSGTYDPQFLGKLAVAGGTAKPSCNPLETTDPNKLCYFQITPAAGTAQALGAKFTAAIDSIRSQAALCEFAIQAPQGTTVNPTQVNVVHYPGQGAPRVVYPFDANKNPNGWTFDNGAAPTKVILHGTSCNDVKVDLKAKVGIVLGCETAHLP